jgi:anti-anti-sigma factor
MTATTEDLHDFLPCVAGRPDVASAAVAGAIDRGTAAILNQAITRALSHRPQRLVVDLTLASSCGATGANILIQAHARADAQAVEVLLRGAKPPLRRVFITWGMTLRETTTPGDLLLTGPARGRSGRL